MAADRTRRRPRPPACRRRARRRAHREVAVRAAMDAQLVVVDHDDRRATGSVTPSSARSSTPTCSPRSGAGSTAGRRSPPGAGGTAQLASSRLGPAELAFHLDRAGDRQRAFIALARRRRRSPTRSPRGPRSAHLERALELWDDAGAAADGREPGDRLWQAAELASATAGQPTSGRGRARPRSRSGHLRTARRWATNGWAATCGRRDTSRRADVEFERAAALLGDDATGAGGCGGRARPGRADGRPVHRGRGVVPAAVRHGDGPDADRPAWVTGSPGPRRRSWRPGSPRRGRRAVS